MRPHLPPLLAALSMCSAPRPAPLGSPTPDTPVLREGLNVAAQPVAKGEPTGLVGGQTMMCAMRKDAPTACIGEIGLALEPSAPNSDDGRYSRTHTDRPIALDEFDLRHLDASDHTRCIYEPGVGPVQCWQRDVAQMQGQYPTPRGFEDVRDVAAGGQTCVVGRTGQVHCRGIRTCFGPEDGDEEFAPTRRVDVPGLTKARIVDKAIHMGCAVLEDATVACWGKTGDSGKCSAEAIPVPDLEDTIDIAVDSYSACALRADNRVFCWGSNARNTLGALRPQRSWTPLEVDLAHPTVKLVETRRAFAALRTDGSIVAWGRGLVTSEDGLPVRLSFKRPAVDLVALSGMVCALLDNHDIECAGRDIDYAKVDGGPRPPFEGKTPWVEAPVYRLAPRSGE